MYNEYVQVYFMEFRFLNCWKFSITIEYDNLKTVLSNFKLNNQNLHSRECTNDCFMLYIWRIKQ